MKKEREEKIMKKSEVTVEALKNLGYKVVHYNCGWTFESKRVEEVKGELADMFMEDVVKVVREHCNCIRIENKDISKVIRVYVDSEKWDMTFGTFRSLYYLERSMTAEEQKQAEERLDKDGIVIKKAV